MHWFWRATIALGVGGVFGAVCLMMAFHIFPPETTVQRFFNQVADGLVYFFGNDASFAIPLVFPPMVVAFIVYGLLTRYFRPKTSDTEIRCRKCRYIQHGIPEPRCSECGEII
ncbi:MAG: hypothetical protein ACYTF1_09965 [Planctomycetota bacterium]